MAMADTPQQQGSPDANREEVSELREIREFLRKNGTSILLAVIVAVVVSISAVAYRNHRQGQTDLASLALATASASEDFDHILDTYNSTPSAPMALLGLALSHYREGEYAEARAAYDRFRGEYPEHPMYRATDICLAQIVEAEGDPAGALKMFEAFLDAHPDSYLSPIAKIGRGRCLQQLGRWDDARTMYEDFVAAHPEGPWTTLAETGLDQVRMNLRAIEHPLPAVVQYEPVPEEAVTPTPPPASEGVSTTNDTLVGPSGAEG